MGGERLNDGGEAERCAQNIHVITMITLKCINSGLRCSDYYIVIQSLCKFSA